MSTLRLPARLYIVGLAGVALAALGWALAMGRQSDRDDAILTLALSGLMAVAWLFPLPFSFKTHLYLDTTVLVAAILLVDPALAILLAGVGTTVAHLLRRQDWVETTFNVAQTMVQAAVGAGILAVGGWDVDRPQFGPTGQAVLILAAGAALSVVGNVLVAAIVGLQSGLSLPQVWSQTLTGVVSSEYLSLGAQVALGVVAAVRIDAQPWTVCLLALPVVAVHSSLARATTRERRAEAALHDRDAALAEAQRVAHLGSWDWSLATGEHLWSDEVFRIAGLAPQAFVPTYEAFLRCVHPDDRQAVDRAVHDALYEGRTFAIDHRLRRPDGSERVVRQQGEVVFDEAGGKTRVVGTVHDITEQKQLERARDELLAAVSHDLKNPLAVIRGQAQLQQMSMRRGKVDPTKVADALASIDAAAGQMLAQIEELVDVGRLQMGQPLELSRDDVDLVVLAQERATIHQRTTDRHVVRVDGAEPALVGQWDKGRLQRVVDNLLANAVKYSPTGGEITVRLGREGRNGTAWALLAVEDRGLGIPASDLPHIGERFHRGANVGRIAGSGIGLAGERQIVEQHGGTIAVASREGEGSTFTVRLPLAC